MKKVLITGGTHGIGEGLAKNFAKKGYEVHIVGRNKERGQRVVESLNNINKANHKLYLVDLSLISENKKFIEMYKEENESLDVLVLNANMRPKKEVVMTDEGLNSVFATGYLSRYMFSIGLDEILNNNGRGRIVHIGDARLVQKLEEDCMIDTSVTGTKSLLRSYTASSYISYFLSNEKIIESGVEFVNPGMVDTNTEEKSSFVIRLISKKPQVITERIVNHIDMVSVDEADKKFYMIDKETSFGNKMRNKKSEFDNLMNITEKYL